MKTIKYKDTLAVKGSRLYELLELLESGLVKPSQVEEHYKELCRAEAANYSQEYYKDLAKRSK